MGKLVVRGLVTVIIAAYDAQRWVAQCLQSVLAQTYSSCDVIVVDDGSTDDTAAIVQQCRDRRVRLIRQENQGQAAATARALEDARGEFIAFLDADDLWKPDKVEKQVAFLDAHSDCVAVYTDAEEFAEFGVDHVSFLRRHAPLSRPDRLMEAMVACHIPLRSTVMLRRRFLDAHHIAPDREAGSVDDIALFMEILAHGGRFGLLDEVTTYRRWHTGNFSGNHFKRFSARIPMYHRLLDRCRHCDTAWKSYVWRALSDAEFRVGEHYWGQGDGARARAHFVAALRAHWKSPRAVLWFSYTLLPRKVSRALRRIKSVLRARAEAS